MTPRSNTLQVVHELPGRLRLRWPADLTAEEQRGLQSMLLTEPWVAALRCSAASRSLVIELVPGCSAVRWQIALAAMGWQLSDGHHASPATMRKPSAPATGGWDQVSREVGGSMIGAVAGQVLLAGTAGTVGAVLFGPQGALILGATGSLFGAVIGSVLGSALADGKNPAHSQSPAPWVVWLALPSAACSVASLAATSPRAGRGWGNGAGSTAWWTTAPAKPSANRSPHGSAPCSAATTPQRVRSAPAWGCAWGERSTGARLWSSAIW
jgi:hypothetical protein